MHYQIYIPKAANVATSLEAVGLAHFVGNAESVREPVGPDSQGGAVFAWWTGGPASRQIGYRPDEQTWHKSACGRYWSGMWKAHPVMPSELVIAHNAGQRIRLGDGNEWLVPALGMAERELTIGGDGTPVFRSPKRFDELVAMRLRWVERLIEQQTWHLTDEFFLELFDVAFAALALNYRLTREAALALSLFSTVTLVRAFNVALGDLINDPGGADGQ